MLFDSHCHLDFPVFDAERDALMQQTQCLGIQHILVPGVQWQHFDRIINLHARWPTRISIALGLHPCFIDQHPVDAVDRLSAMLLQHSMVCAVGEIGLDFRPGMAAEAVQVMLLEEQFKLARTLQLPVVLHVVKAHDRMLSLLRRYGLPKGGVVHAFSGSIEQARQYAKLGFKLGFGGAITYNGALKQHRMVRDLPLEWMLLETDAPDMPLQGFQHQPNSPMQLMRVAESLAGLKGLSVDSVADTTQLNAMQLFHPNA